MMKQHEWLLLTVNRWQETSSLFNSSVPTYTNILIVSISTDYLLTVVITVVDRENCIPRKTY
jgi:hypothetical protein